MPVIYAAIRTMAAMRSAESANVAAVRRAELAAQIQALELAVERERIQAQKEIMLKLIEAAREMENRKMDFLAETFRATHGLIEKHQEALREEAAEARKASRASADANERSVWLARASEIEVDLEDLDLLSAKVSIEARRAMDAIGGNFTLLRLPPGMP